MEKGAAEDEMVRRHRWLNAHEFEQLWDSEEQGAWHPTVHKVAKSWIWLQLNNNSNMLL